jgi:3-phosphoshikimate 1-carboxyvinyltransferase
MTMQLMDQFLCTPELIRDPRTDLPKRIIVPQERYRATDLAIEPDASNATYFLAAAAIREGAKVTIEGLGKSSLQGDVGFAKVLEHMGAAVTMGDSFISIEGTDVLEAIEIDLSAMPDTAQTLAVVALFARGATRISGLHTLRVKETDRIAAVSSELSRLGATVAVEGDDAIIITPPAAGVRPAAIETYDDHRMAMSFAVAGTRAAGVTIRNVECVNKTYPGFFRDLEAMRGGKDEG